MYASGAFTEVAKAALNLTPGPRGHATAATFREIADLPVFEDNDRYPLILRDIGLALVVIWTHYEAMLSTVDEETRGRWLARAKTLREIGEALRPIFPVDWKKSRESARVAWAAVAETFPGDDPRACAIRETWAREAAFLAD